MHIALSCYTVLRGGLHRIWPVCPGVFEWMVPSRDLGKARHIALENCHRAFQAARDRAEDRSSARELAGRGLRDRFELLKAYREGKRARLGRVGEVRRGFPFA